MKIKKLLVASLAIGLFALSACGSAANTGSAGGINKKEILEKLSEKTKANKSSEFKTKTEVTMTSDEGSNKMGLDLDVKLVNEPLQAQMAMNISTNGNEVKMNMYIKDGFVYMNTPLTEQLKDIWMKSKYDGEQYQNLVKHSNDNRYVDFFKKAEKDLVVKEVNGQYEIRYEKENIGFEEVKEVFNFPSINNQEMNESTMKDTNVDKISLVYYVDKATHTPKSMNLIFNLSQKSRKENKMEMKTDATFSSYDQLSEIKIPEDVLSKAVEQ